MANITGTNGNNILVGTGSDDTINGRAGNDILVGGAGDDELKGGRGNDLLFGGSGDDELSGGRGDDLLFGGSGDDLLRGGSGDDVLLAGSGDDILRGGSGDDLLVGGSGDDLLNGGAGNDLLIGGWGDDTYVFKAGSGHDTVLGFHAGGTADRVVLKNLGLTSLQDVLNIGQDTSDGFVIEVGADRLLLFGIQSSQLTADDFVFVNPGGGNTAPVGNDDMGATGENTVLNVAGPIGVLSNDLDADFDALMVSEVNGIAGNVASNVAGTNGGTFIVNADGSYSFDPGTVFDDLALNDTRTSSVSYTVSDGNGGTGSATLTVTVTGANDAPTVSDVGISADEDGATVNGAFTGSDIDSDDDGSTLTYAITSTPAEGAVINNNDGTFTFDPGNDFQSLAQGATTQVTFTYEATDMHGAVSNSGTVTVTVTGVNDEIGVLSDIDVTANIVALQANDGDDVGIEADAADPDAGNTVSYEFADGSLTAANGQFAIDATTGVITVNDANALILGAQSVAVAAISSDGSRTETNFTIEVVDNSNPLPPQDISLLANTVAENTPGAVVGEVTVFDPDTPRAGLSFTLSDGRFEIFDDGTSFLLRLKAGESVDFETEPSIDLVILVDDGTAGSYAEPFTIQVSDVNDQPDAGNGADLTNEDAGVLAFDLNSIASDEDGDTLSFSSLGVTENSALGIDLNTVQFALGSDGQFSIDPSQFNGLKAGETLILAFGYEADDQQGEANSTAAGELVITIEGRNDLPEVTQALVEVTNQDAGDPFQVDLLEGASDPDGDAISAANVSQTSGPAPASLQVIGNTLSIDPSEFVSLGDGESVELQFEYDIEDGTGATTQTLTLTVNGLNDAPELVDDPSGDPPIEIFQASDATVPVVGFDASALFSDTDATDVLTLSATLSGGGALPTGFSFDAASGQVLVDQAVVAPGPVSIDIVATDLLGEGSPVATVQFDIVAVVTGELSDGYISGATVYGDADGDQTLDGGEAQTTTDSDGDFVLVGGSGTLVMSGGVDISTNQSFTGELRAADASTVITPLTTLIVALAEVQAGTTVGLTPAQIATAQADVKTALGLGAVSEDLNNFNQINAAVLNDGNANPSSGEIAQSDAVQLQNTAQLIASLLSGQSAATPANITDAQRAVYTEVAEQINASNPVDLTSTTFITTLINEADTALSSGYAGSANDLAAAADLIVALNLSVDNLIPPLPAPATTGIAFLTEVARAGAVSQTNAAAAMDIGTEAAIDSVTTNLVALLAAAGIGDVTGAKGTPGADTLNGSANVDIIDGLEGGDTITGDAGGDTLIGGEGNDLLRGDAGADTLRGGADTDTVDYGSESGGASVTVDLGAGTATDTHGDTDTISEVENVIGTSGADNITGSAANNVITTGGGADTIDGADGTDTAVFAGANTDYTISQSAVDPSQVTVTEIATTDSTVLHNVEAIEFNNLTVTIPSLITLDNLSVDENADGVVVGTITVTDPENDIASITVDDARFEVTGLNPATGTATLKLKSGSSLNHEVAASLVLMITATDLEGLFIEQSFNIAVNDVNDAPDTIADNAATLEDQPLNLDVLANDSDQDGDALNVEGIVDSVNSGTFSGPGDTITLDSGAQITLEADGTITYDASTSASLTALLHNQVAQDAFQYEVFDGTTTSLETVTIDVTGNGITTTGLTGDPLNAAGTLIVGDNGVGTMTVTDTAAVMSTDAIIGEGPSGDGTVNIGTLGGTDAGTLWDIGQGSLRVGNNGGTGFLRIENGAIVDVDSTGFDNILAGAGTGSFGRIEVSGSGTELISRNDDDTIQIGSSPEPGDNGIAFEGGRGELLVEDGAVVRTHQFEVGRETPIANPLDPAVSASIATVTGTDSAIIVSNDLGSYASPYDGYAGFFRVGGRNDGGNGIVQILDGGLIEVRAGTTDPDAEAPGGQLGRQVGSFGRLEVDGDGSRYHQVQTAALGSLGGPFFQLGRSGIGELEITDGGDFTIEGPGLFFGAASNDAQSEATLVVSGAGIEQSTFELIGTDDNGFVALGRLGQFTGTVSAGANFTATLGANQQTSLIIGQNEGSSGALTVTGAGSTLNLNTGWITVGDFGDGIVEILDGAAASITANNLAVGVGPDSVSRLTIEDSTLTTNATVSGQFMNLEVANEGEATFELTNSTANIGNLNIGPNLDGTGSVTIAAGSTLTLNDGSIFDTGISVGSQGTGILTIDDSTVEITNPNGAFMQVGNAAGSNATVTVTNGSTLDVSNGTLSVSGGAIGLGFGVVGALSTSSFLVDGGSQVSADFINIVAEGDNTTSSMTVSGTGTSLDLTTGIEVGDDGVRDNTSATLTIENGAMATLGGSLRVTGNGTLEGDGSIIADNVTLDGGVLAPGTSVGSLTLDVTNNGFGLNSGELRIEVDGAASFDTIDITGSVFTSGTQNVVHHLIFNGFAPTAGQKFQYITATNGAGGFSGTEAIAVTGLADGFTVGGLLYDSNGISLTAASNGILSADTTLFFGGTGGDTFDTGVGDDFVEGNEGDDALSGGDGLDTARFSGNVSDYNISFDGSVTTVEDTIGTDGTDTLAGFEVLEFAGGGTRSAATNIALSNSNIDENVDGGEVGVLTVTDADAGDTHTFTIDDDRFEIFDDAGTLRLELKNGVSLNHETAAQISILVSAIDSFGLGYTQQFTIDINDVNDDPAANDGTDQTDANVVLNLDPRTNDTDEDGNALNIVGAYVTDPVLMLEAFTGAGDDIILDSGATITLQADGSINYDPTTSAAFNSNFFLGETKVDSFTYQVSDGVGGVSEATITVDLAGVATFDPNISTTGDVGNALADPDLIVGDTAIGTLTLQATALSSDSVVIGNSAGASGSSATVSLQAAGNSAIWNIGAGGLVVGQNGSTGNTLTISDGGSVEATATPGGSVRGSVVAGLGAGSEGIIEVTGEGSSLVSIGEANNILIGRDGGRGDLTISDGGTVSTLYFDVGRDTPIVNPGDPSASASTTTVAGEGSTLIVSNDNGLAEFPYEYTAGFFRVGGRGNPGNGEFFVQDGGRVEVRSGIGVNEDTVVPGGQVGRPQDGRGVLQIEDAGSLFLVEQSNDDISFGGPFFSIGRFGDGTLNIYDGGEFRMTGPQMFFVAGETPTATGTINIDGAGSLLNLRSVDSNGDLVDGGVQIGGNRSGSGGGVANLNLTNGGALHANVRFFTVANGSLVAATVLIDGPDSNLTIESEFTAFGNAGTSDITVQNGGRIELLPAENASGAVIANGEGTNATVTVTGAGSEFLYASTATLNVASNFDGPLAFDAVGTLNVEAGGTVRGASLEVGTGEDTVGTVNVDGATTNLDISNGIGIGQNGGTGTLNLVDTSITTVELVIANSGGSSGTVNVDATSSVNVEFLWMANGDFEFGGFDARSEGTLNINGGSVNVVFGASAGSSNTGTNGVGTINVDGGTLDVGGNLEIGQTSEGEGGDPGGTLNVINGGFVSANNLAVSVTGGSTGYMQIDANGSSVEVGERLNIGEGSYFDGGTQGIPEDDFGRQITGTGTVDVEGDLFVGQRITIGGTQFADGTLSLSGNGTVQPLSGGDLRMVISDTGGASGQVTVSDSASIQVANLDIGVGDFFDNGTPGYTGDDFGAATTGTGILQVSGGSVTVAQTLQVGINAFGEGIVEVTDGTLTVNELQAGNQSGSQATISAIGGTAVIDATTQIFTLNGGQVTFEASNGGTISATNAFTINGADQTLLGDGGIVTAGTGINFVGGFIRPGDTVATADQTGALTLNGFVDLGHAGGAGPEIVIDMQGANQGASVNGFDFLDVDGGANLNSGLVHFNFDGFAPTSGAAFEFLDATGGATGNAAQVSLAVTGLDEASANSLSLTYDSIPGGGITLDVGANTMAAVDPETTFLFGSVRDDDFNGGAGADVLNAGGGTNTLTGDLGIDTFVFDDVGTSNTTITDFDFVQGEILDVSDFGLTGTGDFLSFTDDGVDTTIQIDADDTIILNNVLTTDLGGSFIFA